MSVRCLWNPNKEEEPHMSGLGVDMSGQSLWDPDRGPDMSGLTGVFGGRLDF
jgi:hypothetical protein